MVVKHNVEGYENFLSLMENLKADGPIIVLYSGSKLENGLSWCSDCVEGIVDNQLYSSAINRFDKLIVAAPAIEEGLTAAPESAHVVHVEVGDRAQ